MDADGTEVIGGRAGQANTDIRGHLGVDDTEVDNTSHATAIVTISRGWSNRGNTSPLVLKLPVDDHVIGEQQGTRLRGHMDPGVVARSKQGTGGGLDGGEYLSLVSRITSCLDTRVYHTARAATMASTNNSSMRENPFDWCGWKSMASP